MFDATSRSLQIATQCFWAERNLFRAQYFGDGKGDGKETLEADRQRTRDSR